MIVSFNYFYRLSAHGGRKSIGITFSFVDGEDIVAALGYSCRSFGISCTVACKGNSEFLYRDRSLGDTEDNVSGNVLTGDGVDVIRHGVVSIDCAADGNTDFIGVAVFPGQSGTVVAHVLGCGLAVYVFAQGYVEDLARLGGTNYDGTVDEIAGYGIAAVAVICDFHLFTAHRSTYTVVVVIHRFGEGVVLTGGSYTGTGKSFRQGDGITAYSDYCTIINLKSIRSIAADSVCCGVHFCRGQSYFSRTGCFGGKSQREGGSTHIAVRTVAHDTNNTNVGIFRVFV